MGQGWACRALSDRHGVMSLSGGLGYPSSLGPQVRDSLPPPQSYAPLRTGREFKVSQTKPETSSGVITHFTVTITNIN